MNHQFRKRSDPTRVLLYILIIGVMLAVSVTTAVSAYTIIATAGNNGQISPAGAISVASGGDFLFNIVPDNGYHIEEMTIDGEVNPKASGASQYMQPFTNVNAAHSISVTFAKDTGSLTVNSEPGGATIYIDGISSGKTTRDTVSDITVGNHELKLTLAGYNDYTSSVIVEKDHTNNVQKANLVPVTPNVPTTTPISVSSTPPGATVYLDGTNMGISPLMIPSVSYGTHTLRITYSGYQDSSNTVAVSGSSNTYVYILTPNVPTTSPISVSSTPSGASVSLDGVNKGTTPVTIPSVPYGTHTLLLTYSGYQNSSNTETVSASSNAYYYPLIPTGQISFLPPEITTLPTTVPTSGLTPQPNTTQAVISGTPLVVTPVVNGTQNPGINNSTALVPAVTSPQDTPANGSSNMTLPGIKPPAGLASWNVIIFLFIAVIPLVLLLAHDYLGLGHISFPQPLVVRAGVAFGQVACGFGLLFVLSRMIALLPALTNTLTLPLLLIVLLLGAYLIFSALALAVGSLLSRPLRWTLKVHVVIGVIVLIVTPILLFSLGQGETMAILVTIVAAPVSALLALWQDHSLAMQVQKRSYPFGLFNGDETRVPSGSDPYRRSTATRPDIFPPELADRYTSIDFLGMGGISHVFRAMRLKDGMTVAVKIPIRFDDTTGKCFMKEILAWEGLRHPNIVEITEVNILPIPYVEMEFVKSGLADLKTPLPVKDAAEIVTGVAEGLAYAHEQGIIHRDIKPQNILIDRQGVPKISDWGMSRLIGSSAIPTVAGFSLAYAAPEQISPGKFGETDARTDIYQLGVVFYELVTGKLLFPGDDLAEVSNAIISRMPVPPSEVNPLARPLDPVILKCLQKDPGDRYQSVRTLLEDLKWFLDSQHDTLDNDSWYEGNGTVE